MCSSGCGPSSAGWWSEAGRLSPAGTAAAHRSWKEGNMGKQATLTRPKRKPAASRAVATGPAARAGQQHAGGRIRLGTASWTDPGFVADWYPKGLPAAGRLPWYAKHFDLVEVNSTFYAVPSAATTAKWCDQTPDGFVFDVKLH